MELIIIPKEKYKKIIVQEDEFYDPIIFNTSLIISRLIGEKYEVSVENTKISGILIGVMAETLDSYFKKYIYAIHNHYVDEVYFENGSMKMLDKKDKEELFKQKTNQKEFYRGAEIISQPKDPPYTIILVIEDKFIKIYSLSEDEYDLFSSKNNKIIEDKTLSILRRRITKYVKNGKLIKNFR